LHERYIEVYNSAGQAVEISNLLSWENSGTKLQFNYWRQSVLANHPMSPRQKDFNTVNSIKDQNAISYSAMKGISLAGVESISIIFLTQCLPSDTQEVCLEKDDTITATEVFHAVKILKVGKAAG